MSLEDWIYIVVFGLIFGETAAFVTKKIIKKNNKNKN